MTLLGLNKLFARTSEEYWKKLIISRNFYFRIIYINPYMSSKAKSISWDSPFKRRMSGFHQLSLIWTVLRVESCTNPCVCDFIKRFLGALSFSVLFCRRGWSFWEQRRRMPASITVQEISPWGWSSLTLAVELYRWTGHHAELILLWLQGGSFQEKKFEQF